MRNLGDGKSETGGGRSSEDRRCAGRAGSISDARRGGNRDERTRSNSDECLIRMDHHFRIRDIGGQNSTKCGGGRVSSCFVDHMRTGIARRSFER